jgi:hypothetical protein
VCSLMRVETVTLDSAFTDERVLTAPLEHVFAGEVPRHELKKVDSVSEATVDSVIVDSKSDFSASPLDCWLWRYGSRSVRISKCSTAMAAMQPDPPSNMWHRTLNRHFR